MDLTPLRRTFRIKPMRLPIIIAFVFLAVAHAAAYTPPTQSNVPDTGTESLGNKLLDDLPSGVFEPTVPPTPQQPAPQSKPPVQDNVKGEDVGQQSGAVPLVRARQLMQQAETMLGRSVTAARAGDPQKQAVSQLDEMIAALSKQCQGGNCKPGDKPPSPSQRSQPKPGKSGSKPGQGQAPARDSNDQLNGGRAQPTDKADLDELVKNLWGHLPERSREQMLQSFSDEFLPEYQFEIEQYYKRLAEEAEREPAPPNGRNQ